MIESYVVELFLSKGSVLFKDLRATLPDQKLYDERSDLEIYTDALVERYLSQIDEGTRSDAVRMGDFYRMFYALENDIRDLIQGTMEEQFGANWWGDHVPEKIRSNAKSNKENEETEGIPPRSGRKIDYTTFGELGEIIKSNWAEFRGMFSNCSISRFERVIKRLNLARGAIAHSGMIDPEESVRLKLAIRDWYRLME
jgi:hypothetical protein